MKALYSLIVLSCMTCSLNHAQNTVTWSEDVACILFSHCTQCHNSNGVAPFAIENYQQAYDRRFSIIEAIEYGEMPPWPAKFPESAFAGDHSLSLEEIRTIQDWINGGSPEGDPALAPETPIFETNEEYADADLVIELPEFRVPNLTDNDLYKCFVFPVEMQEDHFVKAIEVIPGNPKAVHHVLLYHDTSNIPIQLDNADPEIGYTCFGGIGSNNAQLVGGWAPGGAPQVFPENMGIRIPAKTNLVVQVHYPEYAVGELDQTHINLKLTTEPQREVFVVPFLNHFTSMLNGPLVIGPEEVKEFLQLWTVPFLKLTLIGIAPHAHLICTEMESWAEHPNGNVQTLVHTPQWDFDWQKFYAYKRPIILEAGTKVYGRAVYDNTHHNHHNPNNPPKTITVGEDTDEEMMLFFLTVTEYRNGDENLVFEESLHREHIDDCGWSLTSYEQRLLDQIELYPNPVQDEMYINSEMKVEQIKVFNNQGQKLIDLKQSDINYLDMKSLAPGSYSIQLFVEGKVLTRQLVKI